MQIVFELMAILMLPVAVFINQMSDGKLARKFGYTESKRINLGFGIIFLSLNVLSIWGAVEFAQRIYGAETRQEEKPSSLQQRSAPDRPADIIEETEMFPGPNGTAEKIWENYGSVSSETPFTHYISREINRLNIRNGPSTEADVVGTRKNGSCIRVLETRGAWSKVVVPTVGGPWAYYASSLYLIPIRPSQSCQ